MLTSKCLPGADARAASRFIDGSAHRYMSVLTRVQQLKPIAEEAGLSMAALAVAWVLQSPNVSAAIVGVLRPQQLEDNVTAAGVRLDNELLRRIDEIIHAEIRIVGTVDTVDAGDALSLKALGVGEPSPTPPEKGAWRAKAAFIALLPVLVIATLAGVIFAGQAILFPATSVERPYPTGPKGHCFVLDRQWCSSLELPYIEQLAGIQFPPGAEVIDSGSSSSLTRGREWATVRWPEGTSIPDPPESAIMLRSGAADSDFLSIDAKWRWDATSYYSSTIKRGLGTDGRPRLTVERSWDG